MYASRLFCKGENEYSESFSFNSEFSSPVTGLTFVEAQKASKFPITVKRVSNFMTASLIRRSDELC